MLDGLFEELPEPPNFVQIESEPTPTTTATISSSTLYQHTAMLRAFCVSEITTHIRLELCGYDLKSMVQANHLWWKTFAPFLWENIYIDADPMQDGRHVIFRNGLAARSLTLSIYDPLDKRGVVEYVAERCRHVTHLHLKLFSPDLVVIRQRNGVPLEVDTQDDQELPRLYGEVEDYKSMLLDFQLDDGENYQDPSRMFGEQRDCDTTLLDSLLSKMTQVSDLTLSLSHEDLKPEVLWCVTKLPRLRQLTIRGGLKTSTYMIQKNRHCNWDLVMRVAKECQPFLESLNVAWECRPAIAKKQLEHRKKIEVPWVPKKFDRIVQRIKAHIAAPEAAVNNVNGDDHQRQGQDLAVHNLKWLSISHCELFDSDLDIIYGSCPNLRGLIFVDTEMTFEVLENNLRILSEFCPMLRTLTFPDLGAVSVWWFARERSIHTLFDNTYPLHNLRRVKMPGSYFNQFRLEDVGTNIFLRMDTDGSSSSGNSGINTSAGHSITDLHLTGWRDFECLFVLLATVSGLTRLTVTGYLVGPSDELYFNSKPKNLPRMHELHRLPFASGSTIEFLDLSELHMDNEKESNRIMFDRIQQMPCLKRLHVSLTQILRAKLEETWDDPDEDLEGLKRREEVGDGGWLYPDKVQEPVNAGQSTTEKIFCHFPSVEYLYILDDAPSRQFIRKGRYISEHMANALVRMMPKLKVMSFDRDIGVGLRRVKKTYPNVAFDCV
ncbi:hypothetical protein BG011_010071 [Mortierella polycephala]|uniref:Uncharacterized protein n=1 Tax=Mortierella polycephala TaxID=41804 RepID=A0A9P6TW16_9FUNG|nr:hypothetical protein BG011_010071 [Mortierella polycephala]